MTMTTTEDKKMIKKDPIKDGTLLHIYSDKGLYIRQIDTGIEYKEAYESAAKPRHEYEEVLPKEAE